MTSETPLTIRLACGTLRLRVEHAEIALAELCGYASRRSRKRGFVFLSKVLGKHYPVRPSRMEEVHTRLAAKLSDLPGPVLLIGMAETATGLGHGIHERWLHLSGRTDLLFLHTTRYRLRRPPALHFEESHSHATEHLLYAPADPGHARLFRQAATLVLVDDEISTGNTLVNLAVAYRRLNGGLASVRLVSITDWLSADRRGNIARRIGLPTAFHSLVRGTFSLTEDSDFDPGPIPDVVGRGDCKDPYLSTNYGRLGVSRVLAFDFVRMLRATGVRPGERLLVLGSGEFAYPPYLLARYLEQQGWDVYYQSTTRSPLLVGADIASVLEFSDNYHDAIPNYVYNVSDHAYDRVLVGYETHPLPAAHRLPEKIGAEAIFFRG